MAAPYFPPTAAPETAPTNLPVSTYFALRHCASRPVTHAYLISNPATPTSSANPNTCLCPTTLTSARSPESAARTRRSHPSSDSFSWKSPTPFSIPDYPANPCQSAPRLAIGCPTATTTPGASEKMPAGPTHRPESADATAQCPPAYAPPRSDAATTPTSRCPPRSSCTRESSAASHSY